MESLQEWGSYMKLAIPSALMICFEWWIYEFGGFFAGVCIDKKITSKKVLEFAQVINLKEHVIHNM